jgi:hypothetical protein
MQRGAPTAWPKREEGGRATLTLAAQVTEAIDRMYVDGGVTATH